MLRRSQFAIVIISCVLGCITLAACGGSKGDVVVVRAGSHRITKATVAHWIDVEAITSHLAEATKMNAEGLTPVPPDYVNCINYLHKVDAGRAGGSPSRGKLKHECATKYTELKAQILEILITCFWLADEGAQKGVRITQGEVAGFLHERFGTAAKLKQYLELTGESAAEERMLARSTLLGIKLQNLNNRGAHGAVERQRALGRWVKAQLAKWVPRTSCDRGYVVFECKEYRRANSRAR